MNKTALLSALRETLLERFEHLRVVSRTNRAGANDAENRSEGKYDTRSTEGNYLADGLALQAMEARAALNAYEDFAAPDFSPEDPIELGAAIRIQFPGERTWIFLGPAGGGMEFAFEGKQFTIITPESPLGAALLGRRQGEECPEPKAAVLEVA